jgi:glycosyltransferase involved in cell wall biosynthesis
MAGFGEVTEQYTIVVPAKAKEHRQIAPNVDVYSVKARCRPVKFVKLFLAAWQEMKQGNYNVVTSQDPFETGFIAWRMARRFGAGLHLQLHGDFFSSPYWRKESYFNLFRYHLARFLLERANGIRVVSSRVKEHLVREFGVARDRVIKVPVYSALPELGERAGSLREKYAGNFLYLYLGRLTQEKNLGMLIRAFSQVHSKYPASRLVIAGRGPEKKRLEQLALLSEASGAIVFLDWTDDVWDYYRSADVFVLPSNYEGWGRVAVEAAHAGVPVIMTDVGLTGEFIHDRESGLVVPVGDKDALAGAMLELRQNENLRKRLAANAQKALERLPGKQKTLNLYLESWLNALRG